MTKWTASEIPPQNGRLAIVTGTGGLGYETSLALARAGAEVIVAGRNPGKGAEAVAAITSAVPGAKARFEALDLARLQTVADFATRIGQQHERVDLLINNAGVMVRPRRQETADGFELQFGTNYLGHFALTAHLLPLLRNSSGARVISLSSIAARQGQIDLADLQCNDYVPMKAYSQSKLACLMFAFELQRRIEAGSWGIASMAAHPGVARTDLVHNGAGRSSLLGWGRTWLGFLFQPAWQGALPTLYAATAPEAKPGGYYGPNQLSEVRGYPAPSRVPPQALDTKMAAALWAASEDLAGVRFPG